MQNTNWMSSNLFTPPSENPHTTDDEGICFHFLNGSINCGNCRIGIKGAKTQINIENSRNLFFSINKCIQQLQRLQHEWGKIILT